ncbi:hypothetical protein J2X13_002672 [Aminobacter aminovorans]|nr:hypothetical protein [Aminobacter aminovorans]
MDDTDQRRPLVRVRLGHGELAENVLLREGHAIIWRPKVKRPWCGYEEKATRYLCSGCGCDPTPDAPSRPPERSSWAHPSAVDPCAHHIGITPFRREHAPPVR